MDEIFTSVNSLDQFATVGRVLNTLYDAAARRFVKLVWDRLKEAHPDLESFSARVSFEYNDEYNYRETRYEIGGVPCYEVFSDRGGWQLDPEVTGGEWEVTEDSTTKVITLWQDVEKAFVDFYGKNYEIYVSDNVCRVSRFETPDWVSMEPR